MDHHGWRINGRKQKRLFTKEEYNEKMLLVVLMLLIAGTAYAATSKKHVKCNVNGKIQKVETADACKALGGTVVEKKKKS